MKKALRTVGRKVMARWREESRRRQWRRDGISIAADTFVHPNTTIGRYTRINAVSHIGECTIGAFCAIGGRLVVRSSDHFTCFLNMQDWAQRYLIGSAVPVVGRKRGDVVIGNAVWMGDSVIVLPDVTIGDGAVIGAGSVVTKSIPDFCVAVGNPARVIKQRFSDELLTLIREIRWWEWSEQKIRSNKELFELDLTKTDLSTLQAAITRARDSGDG